jgi:xylan 1,4-beta-xylosidase
MTGQNETPLSLIKNPILPGFHPDPSILNVGGRFIIATSTFEWFPGIRLFESDDLAHWHLIGHALTRRSQLDLRNVPRSGGIWAPSLHYHDNLYFLTYSKISHWGFGFDDCRNFLVTSPSIEGPWTEPIFLNSGGFDPSLFFDIDGTSWLLNMIWDHRPDRSNFAGIRIQQFDIGRNRLIGDSSDIFKGTDLGCTEGPHLYRRDGWYYLVVAEGGTGLEHAVTIARSSNLLGPYQADPEGAMLTSAGRPELQLQKAGHGSLVADMYGNWYIAHLCGRPIAPTNRCVLGRETAIQNIFWTDNGWPRLQDGSAPNEYFKVPWAISPQDKAHCATDHFDHAALSPEYQTLRMEPSPDWITLLERPGFLRLRGLDSPQSLNRQSLLARRFGSLKCRFETAIEFAPANFQQMAGLMCLYDDQNFYYCFIGFDENIGRHLNILASSLGSLAYILNAPIALPSVRTQLRAHFDNGSITFSYSTGNDDWISLHPPVDATILSDEHTTAGIGFTGAFGALCAQDMSGNMIAADFDYFKYEDL